MSILDIILLVVLGFGLIRGLMNGFFIEIASLVGLALGLYGAIHFSYFMSDFLKDKLDWTEKTIQIVAFASTFIIIVLVISLTGKFLTKVADAAALGIFNKILGALFGALKLALILSVILIVFERFNKAIPMVKEETLENSVLYNPIKNMVPFIFPSIIEREWETDKKES